MEESGSGTMPNLPYDWTEKVLLEWTRRSGDGQGNVNENSGESDAIRVCLPTSSRLINLSQHDAFTYRTVHPFGGVFTGRLLIFVDED
jgi:hypothetical protein